MISIITAIYNQLAMNKLYYQSICQTTDNEWELIIVDNGSTDGSVEYFEAQPHTRVIRNDGNYSYPYCQNIGIQSAKGEVLAFLNNDILLTPHWDSRAMQVLGKNGYEIISLSSNDRQYSYRATKHLSRRWKRVKNPLLKLFGAKEWSLRWMVKFCYGSLNHFADKLWKKHGLHVRPGFAGSAILATRKGLDMIGGGWDETQQGADFDIYLKTCQLHKEGLPIQPLAILCGVYHHHFSRLTFHCVFPPYKDAANLLSCEHKWGEQTMQETIQYLKHVPQHQSISYAITVCNEAKDLDRLLTYLQDYVQAGDEIVVQADQNNVTEEVKAVVAAHQQHITTYAEHPLNFDFAQAKNHLNSLCKGDYIFQLDADEIPQQWLMEHLQDIIAHHPSIGLFKLPRINLFRLEDGSITNERSHWPDYQGRLYKNRPNQIYWKRPLHERIHGYRFYWHLPKEDKFAIIHIKPTKQNAEKWEKWLKHYNKA